MPQSEILRRGVFQKSCFLDIEIPASSTTNKGRYGSQGQAVSSPSSTGSPETGSWSRPPTRSVQPLRAYQNTGAPYQPLSSVQNPNLYAGTASYSTTYYNPGDNQTAGGYPSSGYSFQTGAYPSNQTTWNDDSYANYTSYWYSTYAADTSAYYTSAAASSLVNYQQHEKQWADSYSQTEVTCAPGTEHLTPTGTSIKGSSISGVLDTRLLSVSLLSLLFGGRNPPHLSCLVRRFGIHKILVLHRHSILVLLRVGIHNILALPKLQHQSILALLKLQRHSVLVLLKLRLLSILVLLTLQRYSILLLLRRDRVINCLHEVLLPVLGFQKILKLYQPWIFVYLGIICTLSHYAVMFGGLINGV